MAYITYQHVKCSINMYVAVVIRMKRSCKNMEGVAKHAGENDGCSCIVCCSCHAAFSRDAFSYVYVDACVYSSLHIYTDMIIFIRPQFLSFTRYFVSFLVGVEDY